MTADCIYAKTERGRSELLSRASMLRGRLRAALIVVNGRAPLSALQEVIGDDAQALLDELLRLGCVETVAPDPAGAVPGLADPQLEMRRSDALQRLAPHFGPDVGLVARPLLQAADADAFNRALDHIESKLALYMGRKDAARALAGLRFEL